MKTHGSVWILLGHLQATGVDARGRKQYRYHANWTEHRADSKFDGMLAFGKSLNKLRRCVERDLKRRKLSREAVVAAVVRLLDNQQIRVGNEQYARTNNSFGATTLRRRHIRRKGGKLVMRFRAKGGIMHELNLTDGNLKRVVGRLQELPGQLLFQYVNGDGTPQPVTSSDVNAYIKQCTGCDFTAKDFRTWHASAIAMEQLLRKNEDERITVKTMVEPVAEALGNTPSISRKSYVHPQLIEQVKDNPRNPLGRLQRPRARKRMTSAEVALLKFLKPRRRFLARRKAA